MTEDLSIKNSGSLSEVFQDVSAHMLVSGIIRDQLTNNKDVRDEALKGLDLKSFKTVLDLGCGFGFFTGGLAGRLDRDAEVSGIDQFEKYRQPYLESASQAGIRGTFISEGISFINSLNDKSFDLIICSYALYFFPEYIRQISRILRDHGLLVVITHSCPHMKELTYLVKEILRDEEMHPDSLLPYEMLINRFCDYNGNDLLSECFEKISRKGYRSELIFNRSDFNKFADYFRFKIPFFIPPDKGGEQNLTLKIFNRVEDHLNRQGSFLITKDDTIFVCSKPLREK